MSALRVAVDARPLDIDYLSTQGIGRYAHSLIPPLAEVAAERGVSPQQVCLAWLLAKADVVIPIPGSSRPETIRDSAAAAGLELTAEELGRLG